MSEISEKQREYQRQLDVLYERVYSLMQKYKFVGTGGLSAPLRDSLPGWKSALDRFDKEIRALIDKQRKELRGAAWSEERGLMERALNDTREITENQFGALWVVLVVRPLGPRNDEGESGGDLFFRIAKYGLSHWGRRGGRTSRTVFARALTALTELDKLPIPFGTMTWEVD